ncbi:MAG: hypothetical protein CMO59_14285 [Verrucomicrobiales bacterium]|nr:hypothetical protein [Verrucomicrobiales bacterium]|tara:strand:+ start:1402 stop:1644 length:243 start_codon:yes stop_codon:yes gene_type:complete
MPIRKQDAYGESISWTSRYIRVGYLVFIFQFFLMNLIAQGDSDKAVDSNDLKERATRIRRSILRGVIFVFLFMAQKVIRL